jgi:iron complex transport system substrate-binding protein
MRVGLVTTAALLLLAGTACGERTEPTGALVQSYPVTVQGAGERPTVVDSAPKRIVPVGAGPREILTALGLDDRTVTVNDGLVGLALVDQIRRARPDLIVASADTDPLDLSRARSATHAAVYVEPESSLADVVAAITDIGLATGRALEARDLTGFIEARRREVETALKGTPEVTVFVDAGGFSTILTRSLLGELIGEAHGRSVAGSSPEQGPFPLKRLRQLDPDVYLATADSGRTLASLRANAGTKRLRAVREGRFAIVPADLGSPGPQVGAALEQLARLLHPDAFR